MNAPEPIAYPPLTRTDFVRYAAASGDFNPLHHDHAFAAAAGLPDVMGHGMLSAGLLASALTAWFGAGSVRGFSVRFQKPVWPGDSLTASCEIVALGDDCGARIADLTLTLYRAADDSVISGAASVRVGAATHDDP